MIDVRRLRALSQLAAQGSFSAAADALGMTQSAVSQHIAALEREVGLPVVRRGTRPVELTEAGAALTRHATGHPGSAGNRRAGSRRDRRAPSRPAALRLLPDRAGHADARGVRAVSPAASGRSADRRRRSPAPARPSAGVRRAGSRRDLRPRSAARCRRWRASNASRCSTDRFQAVLPAGSSARPATDASPAGPARGTWIGGAPSSAWYRIVRHACQQAGFSPRADFASDDYIAVQALVAAGLGVSVIPGLAVTHPLPGVAVRQLASAAPVRRISAAWPADGYQGPTLTAMVDSLRLTARGHAMTRRVRRSPPADRLRRRTVDSGAAFGLRARGRRAGLPATSAPTTISCSGGRGWTGRQPSPLSCTHART